MPSLKDLKNRIDSVKSTQKITKAMQMVAAAKLRRAQAAAEAARPFAERMNQVLGNLAPTLHRELGWSETDYGVIVSWFSFAYGFGLVITGRVLDWIGARRGFGVGGRVGPLRLVAGLFGRLTGRPVGFVGHRILRFDPWAGRESARGLLLNGSTCALYQRCFFKA